MNLSTLLSGLGIQVKNIYGRRRHSLEQKLAFQFACILHKQETYGYLQGKMWKKTAFYISFLSVFNGNIVGFHSKFGIIILLKYKQHLQ